MTFTEALQSHRVQKGDCGFRPVGRRYVFVVDPQYEVVHVMFDGRRVPAPMSLEVLLSEYELVEL